MSVALELELTFLAKNLPKEINKSKPTRLQDIYIPESSVFPVLRLRKKGNEFEITKKIPLKQGDYSAHTEHNIDLNEEEFEDLSQASNRKVTKDRYKVEIDGYGAEVDVFIGPLDGLVMLDFEFATEKEKSGFKPPECCLANVTQEKFVLGGQLAGKKYADISEDLERFKYKKLNKK